MRSFGPLRAAAVAAAVAVAQDVPATPADAARQRRNRRTLARLQRAAAAAPALCDPASFPARSETPLRLLRIPKTGSTVATAYARHACPALPPDASFGRIDAIALAARVCRGAEVGSRRGRPR